MKIKNSLLRLLIALICLGVSSCDHHDEEEPIPVSTGRVQFAFVNEVDGALLETDTLMYTNEAGNIYSVDVLKYYISNMTFIKSDGTEHQANENYELIDNSVDSTKVFEISGVPTGDYTAIRFNVGVDSTKNFSGPMNGDLDPVYGMLWDWSSGYVFWKHEGYFIDSTGAILDIHFHYGTLKALVTEEIPVNIEVNGDLRIITIAFNLNKVYHSPNVMDFNGENWHQSTGPGENGWVQLIKQNFEDAFEVVQVH